MMDAEPDMMQTEEVEEEQMPTGLMARRT